MVGNCNHLKFISQVENRKIATIIIANVFFFSKVTNKEVLSRLDMKTTMLLQKAKTQNSNILVTSNAMKHLRDTFWKLG